eukprot:CAMPEP_0201189832 /NCGR_PEP_ID=MMETSP0851-20130426/138720_1 /ASSEMBLY_ACC=CAM_ASM_000631 /TAXON_ID=183588 /ORGANISM="Pseudo-nitzschia fraudulenta, Strain WWA7" /LENGTH=153 /DNA_ID=CAMNT_0047475735 /DNA_START=253 /DNA_END=711 /DNA_ORIENTATION=+
MIYFDREHGNFGATLLWFIVLGLFPGSSSQSLSRVQNKTQHHDQLAEQRASESTTEAGSYLLHLPEKYQQFQQEQEQQNQQQQRIIQQNDSNMDCSLCQGVPLLSEKIPMPRESPNMTCSMYNDYFLSDDFPPPAATVLNTPGTCLANFEYNF